MKKEDIEVYMKGRPFIVGILGFIMYLRFTLEIDEFSMKIALEQANEFLCEWEKINK